MINSNYLASNNVSLVAYGVNQLRTASLALKERPMSFANFFTCVVQFLAVFLLALCMVFLVKSCQKGTIQKEGAKSAGGLKEGLQVSSTVNEEDENLQDFEDQFNSPEHSQYSDEEPDFDSVEQDISTEQGNAYENKAFNDAL